MSDEKECDIQHEYLEASRLIHKNKCCLVGLIITPDGSKKTWIDVYDGINTTEPKVCRMRCASSSSRPFLFGSHVILQRGLYVDLHDDAESCMVLWHPLPD